MKIKENKDLFESLLVAKSPSGMENDAIDVWGDIMGELKGVSDCYSDKMGNVAYSIGSGPVKLLLSGHIDEVNCRVSSISKDGVITIMNTGGMCKKSLVASHVIIMGDNGPVDAIIEKKAIHCEKGDETDKVEDVYKMHLNIGAESAEDVEKMGVHIGSPVVYARNTNMDFGKNQICSQGLDDKVGVFITYQIMKELSKFAATSLFLKKYTIIGLAAVQEETGLRGAQVAAKEINPDISIDFDVTFATDGEVGIDKGLYGEVKLGSGGVIQYGPDKSDRLNKILCDVCKSKDIPFQRSASRAGGTNTNAFQLRSKDCETTLVSIPNRNMHTPVEVVDWRDIKSIVDMVVTAITKEKI